MDSSTVPQARVTTKLDNQYSNIQGMDTKAPRKKEGRKEQGNSTLSYWLRRLGAL